MYIAQSSSRVKSFQSWSHADCKHQAEQDEMEFLYLSFLLCSRAANLWLASHKVNRFSQAFKHFCKLLNTQDLAWISHFWKQTPQCKPTPQMPSFWPQPCCNRKTSTSEWVGRQVHADQEGENNSRAPRSELWIASRKLVSIQALASHKIKASSPETCSRDLGLAAEAAETTVASKVGRAESWSWEWRWCQVVLTLLLLLLLLLFLQEYRANNRSWRKQLEICCNENAVVTIVKSFFVPSFLPQCLKVLKSSPEWKSSLGILPWFLSLTIFLSLWFLK